MKKNFDVSVRTITNSSCAIMKTSPTIDFFEIGPPKTGSTIIRECLAEHPQIFMYKKGFHYLEDPYYKDMDEEKLKLLFSKAKDNQLKGAKRALALCKSEIPQRLYNINPKMKIITVLRNPIDRAVSAYFFYINNGKFPCIPIEKGLPELLKGDIIKKYPLSSEILECGNYYKYLLNYLEYFAINENIKVFFFDDFKKSSGSFITELYNFLNIDSSYQPNSLNTNVQPSIYSINRLKYATLGNRFRYIYDSNNVLLKKNNRTFFESIGLRIIEVTDHYICKNIFSNAPPMLSSDLKRKLIDYYFPDIKNLEKLLNKDLSTWLEY